MAFFDGGASQFAGGGFMPSQTAGGDAGYGGTPMQPKKSRSDQTLRAVTIKQLVKDTANTEDDGFAIDGVEVTNVTIIGKILDVNKTPTYMQLTVEDGTGKADVRYWINDEGSDWFNQRCAEWIPGTYVRVYGHLRSFDRKRSLVGYNIKVVRDFNEITFHLMQCIFQHKYFTSGGVPQGGNDSGAKMGMGATGSGFGGTPMSVAKPAMPAPSMQTPAAPMTGGAPVPMNTDGGGQEKCTEDVLSLYNAPEHKDSSTGLHINQVADMLRGQYTFESIKRAIDFLQVEGHIYDVNDGCYKSCM